MTFPPLHTTFASQNAFEQMFHYDFLSIEGTTTFLTLVPAQMKFKQILAEGRMTTENF